MHNFIFRWTKPHLISDAHLSHALLTGLSILNYASKGVVKYIFYYLPVQYLKRGNFNVLCHDLCVMLSEI
jgi:hypothetical protein